MSGACKYHTVEHGHMMKCGRAELLTSVSLMSTMVPQTRGDAAKCDLQFKFLDLATAHAMSASSPYRSCLVVDSASLQRFKTLLVACWCMSALQSAGLNSNTEQRGECQTTVGTKCGFGKLHIEQRQEALM